MTFPSFRQDLFENGGKGPKIRPDLLPEAGLNGSGFNSMLILNYSTTWTVPHNGFFKVTCVGGGGGGGASTGEYFDRNPSNGYYNIRKTRNGDGGSGGGDTSFGTFLSVMGGGGGMGGVWQEYFQKENKTYGTGGIYGNNGDLNPSPGIHYPGAGGGSGEYKSIYLKLAALQKISIVVGAGGPGGSTSTDNSDGGGALGGKATSNFVRGGKYGGEPGIISARQWTNTIDQFSAIAYHTMCAVGGDGGYNGFPYGGGGGGGTCGITWNDAGWMQAVAGRGFGGGGDGSIGFGDDQGRAYFPAGSGGAGGNGAVIIEYYNPDL
jgi:hypothetical protein